VHALPATIEALRKHIFNGVIWPDFTRLPSAEAPLLAFEPFAIGEVLAIGERRIEVLPAVHTVPAVGFAVLAEAGAWVFTGDTGPNPALWQRLRSMKVAHLVIEAAFSDEERALAKISSHLCPSMLGKELMQLEGSVAVHITHIKPGEVEAVMGQIGALGSAHRIAALASGQVLEIGRR
jgi:cAMP phosphodiesterase